MASPRLHHRWGFTRMLRLTAIIATLAVPALAVATIDASAHPSHTGAANGRSAGTALTDATSADAPDDLRQLDDLKHLRLSANAARTELLRKAALTPAQRARASRDLIRKVLTLPQYVRPVPGPVTQWYGYHPGIDIAPPFGTPIGAAHAGIVTFVGLDDGYGMHVEVKQVDGFVTTYSHMSSFTVNVGELVKAGQELGTVGSTGWSTGPHLHFEVHLPDGSRTDPAVWLTSHGVKL